MDKRLLLLLNILVRLVYLAGTRLITWRIGLMLFALVIILQSIGIWQLPSYHIVCLGVHERQPLATTGAY